MAYQKKVHITLPQNFLREEAVQKLSAIASPLQTIITIAPEIANQRFSKQDQSSLLHAILYVKDMLAALRTGKLIVKSLENLCNHIVLLDKECNDVKQ